MPSKPSHRSPTPGSAPSILSHRIGSVEHDVIPVFQKGAGHRLRDRRRDLIHQVVGAASVAVGRRKAQNEVQGEVQGEVLGERLGVWSGLM